MGIQEVKLERAGEKSAVDGLDPGRFIDDIGRRTWLHTRCVSVLVIEKQ